MGGILRNYRSYLLYLLIGLIVLEAYALLKPALLFPGLSIRVSFALAFILLLTILAYIDIARILAFFDRLQSRLHSTHRVYHHDVHPHKSHARRFAFSSFFLSLFKSIVRVFQRLLLFIQHHFSALVLIASYSIIGVFTLLFYTGLWKALNVELLFVCFVLAGILFFAYRIDARYMILPAILLLWLCPFLLIYKFNNGAEAAAIYAFYFLVIGVLLEFGELRKNYTTAFAFVHTGRLFFSRVFLFVGIALLLVFGVGTILGLSSVIRVLTLYLGTVLIFGYLLKYFALAEDAGEIDSHEKIY